MVKLKKYLNDCKNRLMLKNDEKGVVSILVVMVIAVIMIFIFFVAIDYTNYVEKKQRLQHFADNAASAIASSAQVTYLPVGIEEYECLDAVTGNLTTCERTVNEEKIYFTSEIKKNEKTPETGIAWKMAQKEFLLDSNNNPSGDETIKTFLMEVEIFDEITSETTIETAAGSYKVNNPTVVVKIRADIDGPFLNREISTISVGVFETNNK